MYNPQHLIGGRYNATMLDLLMCSGESQKLKIALPKKKMKQRKNQKMTKSLQNRPSLVKTQTKLRRAR
jgi:hypothetical protein